MRYQISDIRCGIPSGDKFENWDDRFSQQPDKLEFVGMRCTIPSPGGEGAPVRTLGRMRNGDMFRICMHFVKKVHWERLYSLT